MYPLLENAPPHDSKEFIDYLRTNNVVVFENATWIIIENCKYHTEDTPWHTAFHKIGPIVFPNYFKRYNDWTWLKKPKGKRTVERFHFHLYPSGANNASEQS
jgi:hypothetical protein